MKLLKVTLLKEKKGSIILIKNFKNWKDLKLNFEKMVLELNERRKKLNIELEENQKNPEKIAIKKKIYKIWKIRKNKMRN